MSCKERMKMLNACSRTQQRFDDMTVGLITYLVIFLFGIVGHFGGLSDLVFQLVDAVVILDTLGFKSLTSASNSNLTNVKLVFAID